MTRPSWDEYFLKMADLVATRATCDRKHVGAVIVRDKRVVSTGYNGSPSGQPHCDDEGHILKSIDGRDSCIRTLHAESNALDDASQEEVEGGTLYCTVTPCYECAKRIVNAGIKRVVISGVYMSQNTGLVEDLFARAEVTFVMYNPPQTP